MGKGTRVAETQQRAHLRQIGSIEARRMMMYSVVAMREHDVDVLTKLVPKIAPAQGDAFRGRVFPNRWADAPTIYTREGFGKVMRQHFMEARSRLTRFGHLHAAYPAPLKVTVQVRELEWDAQLRWNSAQHDDPILEFHAGRTHAALKFEMRFSQIESGDTAMLSRPFEQHAAHLPETLSDTRSSLEEARAEVAELQARRQRLAALVDELEAETNASQAAPPEPHQGHPGPEPALDAGPLRRPTI